MESVVSKLDAMIRIKAELEKGFFNLFQSVNEGLTQYSLLFSSHFSWFYIVTVLIFFCIFTNKQKKYS